MSSKILTPTMVGSSTMIQDSELGSYISLYFHLPFCSKKCPYCHFYVTKTKPKTQQDYFIALKQEWASKLPLLNGRVIYSIYFGGGTPSQVKIELLEDFLTMIFSSKILLHPDVEISFEANPEDLSLDYLQKLKKLPVNRLSIGVQALDNPSLKILDRQHDAKKAIESIETAYKVGFANISIDLMYDLPLQTKQSWHETLSRVKDLPITHLSLYNLTIEPQTVFYKKRKELLPTLPSEPLSVYFLNRALETFASIGLDRYEISAFAKPGFYSRHNTGYWLGREFLGYGCAAFSYFNKKRFKNVADISKYVTRQKELISCVDFEEELETEASLRELLAIRIRLNEGAKLSFFPKLSQKLVEDIETLEQEGLLSTKNAILKLTPKGRLFYDTVASALI